MALMPGVPFQQARFHGPAFVAPNPIGLVLHRTMAPGTYQDRVDGFVHRGGAHQASIHFLVGKQGEVTQFVDTDERANHVVFANAMYIGIEFETIPDRAGERPGPASTGNREPFTGAQQQAGREVIRWICDTHGIPYRYPDRNPRKGGHHNPTIQKVRGVWHGILSHGDLEDVLGNDHSDVMLESDLIQMGVILVRPPTYGAGQCW